jgi:DNA-binding NarL/FixJ family response regulator
MLVEALKKVLEAEYDVVGSVGDGLALLAAAEKLRPDVVVLDIAMPLLNGLDAARQLRHNLPSVKLVFLTMNEDPYLVGEAFRAGASAYLLKQGAAMELVSQEVWPISHCSIPKPVSMPPSRLPVNGRSFSYWRKGVR